jgi:hypothetical protein
MTDDPELNPLEYEGTGSSTADLPDPWQGLEIRQRPGSIEGGPESPGQNASLNPDDANADSDLVRPPRAVQFRVQRRAQFSTFLPALLLIVAGVALIARPDILNRAWIVPAVLGAIAVSLLLRFVFNGRRERGLFFLTVLLLLLMGLGAAAASNLIDVALGWPLIILAPGLAILLTFILERNHDRALVLPGLMLMVAGGVLLPFTSGLIDPGILSVVALYWPVLLLLLALAFLPRAIRDRSD